MSSFACENIHQGDEHINDEFRGRKELNLCLAALLCDQLLLPIREWRCQDIDQVLLHGRCFLSSASSSTKVLGQNRSTSILSKLPTTAWWFRKNVGNNSKLAVSDSKCASFAEANHSSVKSKDSLYFHASSSPVEANNSKSVQFVADNSTVESCSLSLSMSVEAKELKTCRSLFEANYASVKSDDCFTLKSNDSLTFHTSSLPVEANNSKSVPFRPAYSTVESFFLSFDDEQFMLSEEHKLDCDIYGINYGERRQVLVNSDNICDPQVTLCSALMDTFTTFKHAIVILRNVSVAIFGEPNGSFYTFESIPHYNGREPVLKFGNLNALETFLCSLANGLSCDSFDIIPAELSTFCEDKIMQKQITHKERLSRAMLKILPNSSFKRKLKRRREPSRIPTKKVLNCYKKRCFRKPMKRFIVQNIPFSSHLHNLYKHYWAWCSRYVRDSVCCRKEFSNSFRKRFLKNAVNTFQLKSVYKSTSSNSGSKIYSSQSTYLQGGMDQHCLSISNTNVALNSSILRLTERLAAIGLKPVDVGGQGDCFFKSVSHQIHGDAGLHFQIRMAGIRYLRDHAEMFIHSVTGETWDTYISRMSTIGTWCDNLIIQAVANTLNCVIHIVSSEVNSESIIITPLSEEEQPNHIIIGYLCNLHYVSTTSLDQANIRSRQYRNRLHVAKRRSLETTYAKTTRLQKAQEYKRTHLARSEKDILITKKRSLDVDCQEQIEFVRSKVAKNTEHTNVEKDTACSQFGLRESNNEKEHVDTDKEKDNKIQHNEQSTVPQSKLENSTASNSMLRSKPTCKNKSNSNKTQSMYLSKFDSVHGCLHEQAWAKQNVTKFHKSIKFAMIQCTICQERWALKSTPKNSNKYICLRCSRDKTLPKKFSCENHMIPSKVPPELQELTQI